MALQLNVTTRNARLDTIESTNGASCAMRIKTGAPPATTATAESGTTLVTILLPADWMAAAASGAKAKSGTWQDASADATGTAAHFRLYNSQVTLDETTCFAQGTVGQGSGDLSLDNTALVAGQTVTINTFTLTDGNA